MALSRWKMQLQRSLSVVGPFAVCVGEGALAFSFRPQAAQRMAAAVVSQGGAR